MGPSGGSGTEGGGAKGVAVGKEHGPEKKKYLQLLSLVVRLHTSELLVSCRSQTYSGQTEAIQAREIPWRSWPSCDEKTRSSHLLHIVFCLSGS